MAELMSIDITREYALGLDQKDELAPYRERFQINDADLIYMDGNSLGRLPKATTELGNKIIQTQWGRKADPFLE
jgi:kynureninase